MRGAGGGGKSQAVSYSKLILVGLAVLGEGSAALHDLELGGGEGAAGAGHPEGGGPHDGGGRGGTRRTPALRRLLLAAA